MDAGLDGRVGGNAGSIRRWLTQGSTHASSEMRMRMPPDRRAMPAPEPIDDDPDAPSPGSARDESGARATTVGDGGVDPTSSHTERPSPRQSPRQRQQVSDATYAARATNVVFAPRTGIRRALTALLLVMVAAAVIAGIVAYSEQTQPTLISAIALAFLALVVWGARATATPTLVVLKHGQLEVRRAGRTDVADIANARTPIAVVGKPSSRRWRVLIERANEPLLVIDSSMVDPVAFAEVLYQVHPQLWSEPGAVLEPWQLR